MTPTPEMVAKIAKLKELAERAKQFGNEADAQAFAQNMQRLMAEFRVSMTQVDAVAMDDEVDDPIERKRVVWKEHGLKHKQARVMWVEQLAMTVAKGYGVRLLIVPGTNALVLVGRKHACTVAEYVIATLVRGAEGIADVEYGKFYRECRDERGDVKQCRGFRKTFLFGFVQRIRERVEAELRAPSASTALVLFNKDLAEVDNVLRGMPKATPLSDRGRNGPREGYERGRQAADVVDLKGNGVGAPDRRRELGE